MSTQLEDNDKSEQEVPFILRFLEVREGAFGFTTSGPWNDVDASDTD